MAGDTSVGADGTADPPPLPLFPDPLAGLITGDDLVETPRVVVPAPPELPDHAGIRAALEQPPRRVRRSWPVPAERAAMQPPPVVPLTAASNASRRGVAVVIVALLVTALILLSVIQSLASTITQLFG
ncbi:hypothetical protein [Actinocrispum sp. NPDC049592]|uniref:hypothetical protein n=1 Tax=Actinocrispum sp. NPDC049592 TaxID=3154835 RepID=UPI00343FCFA3